MSQSIEDMPGIDAALERFNAMTGTTGAADTATASARTDTNGATSTATRDTKADAQPASTDTAQNSVSTSTDTPAAPEATAGTNKQRNENGQFTKAETDQKGKPAETNGADKSRYSKAQERLAQTWDNVNKRKVELDTQAATIEQQRMTLERDKAQFEAIRRQGEAPGATPEQALQAAQQHRTNADALRMQAKRAEEGGKFDEAARLNKQADKAESKADDFAEYAEQLRRNPPVTMQQRQQQFEQARKDWTMQACNAFPELAKNGSRLQQVVAQHLDAIAKQDASLLVHPSLIIHVTRLADAQIKQKDAETAAARVPVLEKEAESLRARIKELEADATPATNGSVNRLGANGSGDDYSTLRQEAESLRGNWLS